MKFLRDPLFHFMLIGAALFGISSLAGSWSAGDPQAVIAITPGLIANLRLSAFRATGRQPADSDVPGLVEAYVREEVLCREARSLGIDRDDTVIRTVLTRRMEVLAEADADAESPSPQAIEGYYRQHIADYRKPGGEVPPLAEVRDRVESDWSAARRAAAFEASYARMRERYRVTGYREAAPAAAGVAAGPSREK